MAHRSGTFAIGALLLTLLAGVGPALGLSPAIAAFAVVMGLGFFFFDRIFFQGRLLTLVAGLVQERQKGWRERVACHEAGHLLVAHRLGIAVEDYTLGAWQTFQRGYPGSGGVVLAVLARLDSDRIEAYCATWLAGGMAEQMDYGKSIGAEEDLQKIQLLLAAAQRSGIAPARTLRNRAERLARSLLVAEKDLHKKLTQQLLAGRDIEGCIQLLQAQQA